MVKLLAWVTQLVCDRAVLRTQAAWLQSLCSPESFLHSSSCARSWRGQEGTTDMSLPSCSLQGDHRQEPKTQSN